MGDWVLFRCSWLKGKRIGGFPCTGPNAALRVRERQAVKKVGNKTRLIVILGRIDRLRCMMVLTPEN